MYGSQKEDIKMERTNGATNLSDQEDNNWVNKSEKKRESKASTCPLLFFSG